MDVAAKVTSKGQITIPKDVREVLGIGAGDTVMFRVADSRVVFTRAHDLLDLVGTVEVPAAKRNTSWNEVLDSVRQDRVRRNG